MMVADSTVFSRTPVVNGGHATPMHNSHVRAWIDQSIALCKPDNIYYCNGSLEERGAMLEQGVLVGVFIRLNQEKVPGGYLHRSNPNDVARTEQLTFICT